MKRLISVTLALLMVVTMAGIFAGCSNKDSYPAGNPEEKEIPEAELEREEQESQPAEVPVNMSAEFVVNPESTGYQNEEGVAMENPVVTIEMEDGQKIVVELLPEFAPNTVKNFVKLVEDGFYDGVVFHRIVPGFMIQGGDPDGTGMGGPSYSIAGEFTENGFDANIISHTEGVISMARSGHPDSAGSQFFICDGDASFLDGSYAAFGRVIEGLEVVNEIAQDPAQSEMAVTPRVMKSVTVETFGIDWEDPETV